MTDDTPDVTPPVAPATKVAGVRHPAPRTSPSGEAPARGIVASGVENAVDIVDDVAAVEAKAATTKPKQQTEKHPKDQHPTREKQHKQAQQPIQQPGKK